MVFIGGNKRQVKNELLEIICLSLEKFLTSIPFHKVGKNIKDFLLWFASPKTFPKIPKTIPWPWPQLVAIYTPLYGNNLYVYKNRYVLIKTILCIFSKGQTRQIAKTATCISFNLKRKNIVLMPPLKLADMADLLTTLVKMQI